MLGIASRAPGGNNYYMARRDTTITAALRRAIAESDLSFRALEEATGVLRQSLMKFVRGEQSLRLDQADKLVAFFGLRVVQKRSNG